MLKTKSFKAHSTEAILLDNADMRHIYQDHLGSTTVTDNGIVSSMKFYPFGDSRNSQGNLATDKLFTGQRLDGTGLYYYNARYYDPLIGRFISADTVVPGFTNPQAFNRYSYVINNPLRYIDPTGRAMVGTKPPIPKKGDPPPEWPPGGGGNGGDDGGGGGGEDGNGERGGGGGNPPPQNPSPGDNPANGNTPGLPVEPKRSSGTAGPTVPTDTPRPALPPNARFVPGDYNAGETPLSDAQPEVNWDRGRGAVLMWLGLGVFLFGATDIAFGVVAVAVGNPVGAIAFLGTGVPIAYAGYAGFAEGLRLMTYGEVKLPTIPGLRFR